MMAGLRYSAQVFAYVKKPIKKRLVALRRIDHNRYAESRVIERCLEACLSAVEEEAADAQHEREADGRRPSVDRPTEPAG